MIYQATKTWGTDLGLSCCFRQWRAAGSKSHCHFLHGYAIGVRIVFETETLDDHHWVYDFGNLDWIKALLVEQFDHKTIIAADDPELATFEMLAAKGLIQLRILPLVSCEMMATWLFEQTAPLVYKQTEGRVKIKSVEVFEHGANSARVIA